MSYITLQFGQCGNQIGQALYECVFQDIKGSKRSSKQLSEAYINEATSNWFSVRKNNALEARSVLIDTENKVTDLANKTADYKFKNIVAKSYGGSANNWAYGYNVQSNLVIDAVIEKVQSEIEKCDFINSFLNILSSSGGTGSGVGSRVIEHLRDEYPTKFITNFTVLPFRQGDVVIQNYNTLLMLTKLHEMTDCTVLFENDKVHQVCKRLTPHKDIKLCDINNIIAQQITAVCQPVKDLNYLKLIAHLTSHPSYKFVQINSAPHLSQVNSKYEPLPAWSSLIANVLKNSKSDVSLHSKLCKRIRNVGRVVITRGSSAPSAEELKSLQEPPSYVPWVPESERLSVYTQTRSFLDYDKYLCSVSNSNNVCSALDVVLEESWKLFTHQAYLHHYRKYGIVSTWTQQEKEGLLEALRKHGVADIEAIADELPYKSVYDVRTVITKYENLGRRSLADSTTSTGNAAIDKWINIVKQVSAQKKNNNVISRALKYIALYEKRTNTTSNVHLKDCYLVLSDLTSGRSTKEMSGETASFFYGCLSKLARRVKDSDNDREETFLDNMNLSKPSTTKTYGRKVEKNAILADPDVNVLQVPVNLLKGDDGH